MIRDIVAIFGVIAGFTYYVLTVRANQKNQELALESRQVTTYIQTLGFRDKEFMKEWTDIIFQKYDSFEEWESKYGIDAKPDSFTSFWAIANLFQSVGYLVYLGFLTPEIVYDQEGDFIIHGWETQKMVIEGTKQKRGYNHLFEHYESLYGHMIRLRNKELNP
jgi:hypothetical protein